MSRSLEVLANGWAIDTTPPVDLKKPADNDVSGPLRSCLSLTDNASSVLTLRAV